MLASDARKIKNKKLRYKENQMYLLKQIKQNKAKRMEHMRQEKETDHQFLKNIGMTEKTNKQLHMWSKQVKKRYRDSHVSKDLESRAWVDPVAVVAMKSAKDQTRNPPASKSQAAKSFHQGGNRASGGTLFNQFYRPNKEMSPMKPLAPNLDSQIENLESIQNEHIQSFEKLLS